MLSFYSRILVAYDGSDLSRRGLDIALDLAKKDSNIQLGVLIVGKNFSTVTISGYGIYSQQILDDMKKHDTDIAEEVRGMLAELPNRTRVDLLEGTPGKVIVEFAKKNDFDLIVIGSRGLSGVKELFLGSVSHYVVQRSHCPVFVVK